MAKTLVVPRHMAGPFINGEDGCFARAGNHGMCPGVDRADWLNNLGDDEDIYIKGNPEAGRLPITCGQVRDNWLRDGVQSHITAAESVLASLNARQRQLSAELRIVKRDIKRVQDEKAKHVSQCCQRGQHSFCGYLSHECACQCHKG